MHSLIENAKLACELIPILEHLVSRSLLLLFLIYEFGCFFRFHLRSSREHTQVHRGADCFIDAARSHTGSGSFVGTVTDPTGAVVANAAVKATNGDIGKDSTARKGRGNLDIRRLSVGVFGRVAPRDYQAVHDLYMAARNDEVPESREVKLRLVRPTDEFQSNSNSLRHRAGGHRSPLWTPES